MQKIFNNSWEKFGKILEPKDSINWIKSHTGSPFVTSNLEIFFTGRDKNNISRIGKGELILEPVPKVVNISDKPILSLGDEGCFDFNGTSYPYIANGMLFYTGWFPGSKVPFINNVGIAKFNNGIAERISKAPILHLTNNEPYGNGSVCVIKESNWHMWYTSFVKWENKKHYYLIKYAKSKNGIDWERNGNICIHFDDNEYSICRPSVIKISNIYHMIFCVRGIKYKLGYAYSKDKINWFRDDSRINLKQSADDFDSQERCYPFWFLYKNYIYLLYSGNDYGNSGIGIARTKIW